MRAGRPAAKFTGAFGTRFARVESGPASHRTNLRLAAVVPLARPPEGGDDAVQGAQLLLGTSGALKQVAQVARHARALVGVAQEAALVERLLEMLEKAQELRLV